MTCKLPGYFVVIVVFAVSIISLLFLFFGGRGCACKCIGLTPNERTKKRVGEKRAIERERAREAVAVFALCQYTLSDEGDGGRLWVVWVVGGRLC